MDSEKRKRKKLFSRVPCNLAFWRWTLGKKEEVKDFIERGDDRQHNQMIRVLNYLRRFDKEYYKQIDGKAILIQLKAEEENEIN